MYPYLNTLYRMQNYDLLCFYFYLYFAKARESVCFAQPELNDRSFLRSKRLVLQKVNEGHKSTQEHEICPS